MRISPIFAILILAIALLGCGRQVPTEKSQTLEAHLADESNGQRIQSDINWEKLDIGEVDFSTDLEDVQSGLDLVEQSLE